MNLLITAGGTSEPIDSVRRITNTSTGKLATFIHREWLLYQEKTGIDLTIHYVVATPAVMPDAHDNTTLYTVTDTFSVQTAIQTILKEQTIDIIIHLMAISDFTVSNVRTTNQLGHDLAKLVREGILENEHLDETFFINFLNQQTTKTNRNPKKISSKDNLELHLSQTPKIIKEMKLLSPKSRLVGFKLLDHVSEEELIKVASDQAIKNQCEFVVANDLSQISATQHHALLVKDGEVLRRCQTKKEIAVAIVKELTQ